MILYPLIRITSGIINVASIILHMIGCNLLLHLYNNGEQEVEDIYLINLSFIEIIECLIHLVLICLSNKAMSVRNYLQIIHVYGSSITFFLTIIYITLNRYFEIVLNIRYHLYWNVDKAKQSLQLTWLTSFTVSLILLLIYGFTDININD